MLQGLPHIGRQCWRRMRKALKHLCLLRLKFFLHTLMQARAPADAPPCSWRPVGSATSANETQGQEAPVAQSAAHTSVPGPSTLLDSDLMCSNAALGHGARRLALLLNAGTVLLCLSVGGLESSKFSCKEGRDANGRLSYGQWLRCACCPTVVRRRCHDGRGQHHPSRPIRQIKMNTVFRPFRASVAVAGKRTTAFAEVLSLNQRYCLLLLTQCLTATFLELEYKQG